MTERERVAAVVVLFCTDALWRARRRLEAVAFFAGAMVTLGWVRRARRLEGAARARRAARIGNWPAVLKVAPPVTEG